MKKKTRQDQKFRPASLLQHFTPPDGYQGVFGWLCGYSADAAFLNEATEQFCGQSYQQRANSGGVHLALMLDPSNPQLPVKDVPGVFHLPLYSVKELPFRLMHAKVAILGFRHDDDRDKWCCRLIVSTGNWTLATLHESLDLAWRLDLNNDQLRDASEDVRQAKADFRAAWGFMQWLQSHFDTRLLQSRSVKRNQVMPYDELSDWAQQAGNVASSVKSRFFDSRSKSLLDQIPRLVKKHAGPTARNYVALGSGFFEKKVASDHVPSVLMRTVGNLQAKGLLTASAKVDILVEPKSCQAVSQARQAITDVGWAIREPWIPEYFGSSPASRRRLHAKFIFGANFRGTEYCTSAWLYLGSGNLTNAGFTEAMSRQSGNLEAGVVLNLSAGKQKFYTKARRGTAPEEYLPNLLPLQWETCFADNLEDLAEGERPPVRAVEYIAAPVSHLIWNQDETGAWLSTEETLDGYDVIEESGTPCERLLGRGFSWKLERPREVLVQWHSGPKSHSATVPIVDQLGRVAATDLQKLDLDQAWSQLAAFPQPPDGDDDSEEDIAEPTDDETAGLTTDERTNTLKGKRRHAAAYPIRQMMQFIENIADRQCLVHPADWSAWCVRLERSLMQARTNPVLEEFKRLGLNPLSPLRMAPFRPDFAQTDQTDAGIRYCMALDKIEESWGVGHLASIGEGK